MGSDKSTVDPAAEARSALAKVSERAGMDRSGVLPVPSPRIMEPEVKVVRAALENPPQRPDLFASLATCLSVGFFIAKTAAGEVKTIDVVGIAIAFGLGCIVVWRYISQLRKKDHLHEIALQWICSLPAAADQKIAEEQSGPLV